MQTIHFAIEDDKTVSTPDNPILIEGESMTSEIVVTRVPADWEGYELRIILTTPGKIKMESIPVGSGVPLTNAMLDSGGKLVVEFGAYQGTTKIYRSRSSADCKLTVHGSSDDGSTNPPDALPSIIAELSEAKTAAIVATTSANTAAQTANDAAADCRGAIETATSIIAELSEAKTAAIVATTSALTAAQTAKDAAVLATERIETMDAEIKAAEVIRTNNELDRNSSEISRRNSETERNSTFGSFMDASANTFGGFMNGISSTFDEFMNGINAVQTTQEEMWGGF